MAQMGEPYIHAAGTAINNQYKGPTAWDDHLSALEAAAPTIQAIAVTDYYVLRNRATQYRRCQLA
jgi:hypothetical protein